MNTLYYSVAKGDLEELQLSINLMLPNFLQVTRLQKADFLTKPGSSLPLGFCQTKNDCIKVRNNLDVVLIWYLLDRTRDLKDTEIIFVDEQSWKVVQINKWQDVLNLSLTYADEGFAYETAKRLKLIATFEDFLNDDSIESAIF